MLPKGYTVWEDCGDSVIIAVDMMHFMKDAPTKITLSTGVYRRDNIEDIPKELVSKVCSMRRYIKES